MLYGNMTSLGISKTNARARIGIFECGKQSQAVGSEVEAGSSSTASRCISFAIIVQKHKEGIHSREEG